MAASKDKAEKLTPVMEQHARAKRAFPDCLIFFRLGDFYEMFGDDAGICASVLNLTLTARNRGKPDELPMAGVPFHAAHAYIGRLLSAGYKVAICEQLADPKTVKGLVPRDVVRVLTPGLVTLDEQLTARENNWLAALEVQPGAVALALLDISTGELRCAAVTDVTQLLAELHRAAPREALLDAAAFDEYETSFKEVVARAELRRDEALDEAAQRTALGALAPDLRDCSVGEARAVARVLRYARRCNPLVELPVRAVGRWDPGGCLLIDRNAARHLELVESNVGERSLTLLATLDETETSPGGRLLRRRLLAPLSDLGAIRARHDQVELFVLHSAVRERIRQALRGVGDLERMTARIELGEGTPRDLGAIRDALCAAARVADTVDSLSDSDREVLGAVQRQDVVPELALKLSGALVERPPALAKEGAIFVAGFDARLTELDTLRTQGTQLVLALEERLRHETAISTLKVRYTRVFGWYIEVSRSGAGKVPKDWRRKQTVATGERFTLDALDELAVQIDSAEEQHRERELGLLRELNEQVRREARRLGTLCEWLSQIDVAAALAEVAHRNDYCRPMVSAEPVLELVDSRHPVVERRAALGRFVPNDVQLDVNAGRLWLITGPNMAGKSTFLRQVALCTILAQMGSFVPAKSAQVGLVDRVLSRVGASDNLSQGQSTFMVEMQETAEILRSATARSLVILDEIGRGTSTFDGLSIAWAVAEHLDEVCRSRALFATHYHELTELANQSEHVRNFSVSAREEAGDVVFLHRVVPGAANRSYGIAVAKLAGLPESVLARSKALLASLEGEAQAASASGGPPLKRKTGRGANQLGLFDVAPARETAALESDARIGQVIETLRAVDLNRLSPLEAHSLVAKLKKRL